MVLFKNVVKDRCGEKYLFFVKGESFVNSPILEELFIDSLFVIQKNRIPIF